MGGGSGLLEVVHLATCASTMDEARRRFGAGACGRNEGATLACVVADEQTAGRGRRGHVWEGRSGESLMVTYAVWLPASLVGGPLAGWITLGAGVAVLDGIRRAVGEDASCVRDLSVKWPNDVYLAGRKLAGILCEAAGTRDGCTCVLVGVGANLVMDEGRLPTPRATALSLHVSGLPPYQELRHALVEAIGSGLAMVLGGLADNPTREATYLLGRMGRDGYLRDRPVRVTLAGDRVVEGVARRVAQDASLVVEVGEGPDTREAAVTAGDVEALPT